MTLPYLIITYVDDSHVSIAIIRLYGSVIMSVCLSVCPHDKSKTAETKITKLGTGIVHHDISPTNKYALLGQRSKVKVRVRVRVRVRRLSGRRELCTSIECFSSIITVVSLFRRGKYKHNSSVPEDTISSSSFLGHTDTIFENARAN